MKQHVEAAVSDEELYEQRFTAPTASERNAAWEELDRRHRRGLLGFCYRITRNAASAEECVNEAFVRVLGTRREITRSFKAYLWLTAKGLAIRAVNARKRMGGNLDGEPEERTSLSIPNGPLHLTITAEERAGVEHCLGTLAQKIREFVLLHVCDGLTFREAAEVVGWTLSVPGCKHRLDRALEKLRYCLRKLGISA